MELPLARRSISAPGGRGLSGGNPSVAPEAESASIRLTPDFGATGPDSASLRPDRPDSGGCGVGFSGESGFPSPPAFISFAALRSPRALRTEHEFQRRCLEDQAKSGLLRPAEATSIASAAETPGSLLRRRLTLARSQPPHSFR